MPPLFRHILILCEGNHCRSPMAAGLLAQALDDGFQVTSAGLAALESAPPDQLAQSLMSERGCDISAHRGRQLIPQMALAADIIFVMDANQKDWCERLVPSVRGRVFILAQWLDASRQDILDPFGHDAQTFRDVLDHIDQSIAAWLPRLTLQSRSA